MRERGFRSFLAAIVGLFIFVLMPSPAPADEVEFDSSTQFLWGDDLLGESQGIFAQYVRFRLNPEDDKFSITGYGRLWDNLANGDEIRDDDLSTRLYYLFLDYRPVKNVDLRFGRQFINFTSGTSIMDGLSATVNNIGPVGLTVAGGMDVKYSLDSEHSQIDSPVLAAEIFLESVKPLQIGLSYFRRYDEGDLAREEVGLSARGFYRFLNPYAEARYDVLSETIDEATIGVNIFPITDLTVKLEYYQAYPTFDATSIFSVFAVDRYSEYFAMAEYGLKIPVTVFASYAHQNYDGDDDADSYSAGARVYPIDGLTVNGAVNVREGFGGDLVGFELFGDYSLKKKYTISAGAQYDTYKRLDDRDDNDYATRYWLGGRWQVTKAISLQARLEDNINESFDHRPLGRVVLTWNL
jgi:hypothetical protein